MIAAAAIPLSLFLAWFEITSGAKEGTFTGWYSFDRTDRVLAALALTALASGFLPPSRRVAATRLVLGLFVISVVVREMAAPPVIDPGTELRAGAYLGLAAGLGIVLGGLSAFGSVRRGSVAALRWGGARLARSATRLSRVGRVFSWFRGDPEPESGETAPSPRLGRGILRGVPSLSPEAFGLFRIVFGLSLLLVMAIYAKLPGHAMPVDLQRGSTWFVEMDWIRSLASSRSALSAVEMVTVVALVLVVVGLFTRVAFSIAALGIATTALVVVAVSGGAHNWGLPSVTVLCMLIVPWSSSGLGLDALIRRRRGKSLSSAPSRRYGLAVWIPGLTMGVAFLAAAYAKLSISGLVWITEGAVRYHFVEDARDAPVDWGLRLASVDELAVLMSLAAVVAEAAFILVTLSARPSVRLLLGLMVVPLLAGIYLFQGMFWPPWWVLLLAFLPWEEIYRAGRRVLGSEARGMAMASRPVSLSGPLRVAALGLVAALAIQQVAVSATRVEEEPFVSNFPMYSDTWESKQHFNETNSKFVKYRFEALGESRRRVDLTARLEALGPMTTLVEASEAREDSDPDEHEVAELRRALRGLDATYQQRYGHPLGPVYVLAERTAGYDFERGTFSTRVVERTTHVVRPDSFEVASAKSD